MGLFDDIGDFISSTADAAVDVIEGEVGGAIEGLTGGDGGLFGGFAGFGGDLFGGITDSLGGGGGGLFDSIGDTITEAADSFGGDLLSSVTGGDGGGLWGGISSVVDTVSSGFDGLGWGGAIDGVMETVTDLGFGEVGGFLDDAGKIIDDFGLGDVLSGDGGLGGIVDWAGEATGLDLGGIADDVGGLWDTVQDLPFTDCWGGVELGDYDLGGLADAGMELLDQMSPSSDGIVGTLLDGADPGSLLEEGLGMLEGATGGFDLGSLAGIGESLGIDVPDDIGQISSFIDSLGSGQTGELLSQLGGEALGGLVGALDSSSASDLLSRFVDDGNLGGLLDSADSGALQGLLGKVADGGGLEDLVGQLDQTQTADLVGKLLGGGQAPGEATPAAPSTTSRDMVDALHDAQGREHAGVASQADRFDDALGVDSVAQELQVADAPTAVSEDLDALADSWPGTVDDPLAMEAPAPAEQIAAAQDAVPAPEPEPDAVDQAVTTADEVESSVDDMFDGLG